MKKELLECPHCKELVLLIKGVGRCDKCNTLYSFNHKSKIKKIVIDTKLNDENTLEIT